MAIVWTQTEHIHDESDLQNAINTAASTGDATRLVLNQNVALTQTVTVPYGATIKFESNGSNVHVIDAGKQGFRAITVNASYSGETIIHIANVKITGGQATGNGGALCSDAQGIVWVVVEDEALIDDNEATGNGGAISLFQGGLTVAGGVISNNKAVEKGGAVYAPYGTVFKMEDGLITQNYSVQEGGGVYAQDVEMTGGEIYKNNTDGAGGGIYLTGNGEIGGTAEIKGNSAWTAGGGIFKTTGLNTLGIKANAKITGNTASGNTGGGGIWIDITELDKLTVELGAEFSGNVATPTYTNRFPIHDAVYLANIHGTVWTSPFTQGYNNADIAYVGENPDPGESCETTTQQMVDISLPVQVRPFANIGTVVSRCCGPATISPGITPPPGSSTDCDFTIHQRICVEVPVEFGATVTPGQPHTECTGENCDSCGGA